MKWLPLTIAGVFYLWWLIDLGRARIHARIKRRFVALAAIVGAATFSLFAALIYLGT